MSSNPMQRKIRNSFLLGILVMLIIAILVGVLAYFLVIKPKKEEEESKAEQVYAYAYRLSPGISVESGEEIDISMLESVEIPVTSTMVMTDFIDIGDLTRDIVDEDGNVYTENKYKSKVDLTEGTILTYSMLYEDEITADSLRYVEYNMITMDSTVEVGDYVDIRLKLPNAHDLIVIPKKQIINLNGQILGFNLTEEEILILNSAIVESYIMTSSQLYLTKYIEPGLQQTAIDTYSPTEEVTILIQANPNIVTSIRNEIVNKYYNSGVVRNPINNEIGKYTQETKDANIAAGMQAQIEAARQAREQYLSDLEGEEY